MQNRSPLLVFALLAAMVAATGVDATASTPRRLLTGPQVTWAEQALETACGSTTPIVDVLWTTYNAVDTDDSGKRAWAYERRVTQHIRIWQTGANAFCEARQIEGTFESIAGVSPGGRGTISAGVTGRFVSVDTQTFTGTFDPGSRPTNGTLADFDERCQIDASDHTKWSCANGGTWFPAGRANRVFPASGFYLYDGGAHGRWLEFGNRSIGDIVG